MSGTIQSRTKSPYVASAWATASGPRSQTSTEKPSSESTRLRNRASLSSSSSSNTLTMLGSRSTLCAMKSYCEVVISYGAPCAQRPRIMRSNARSPARRGPPPGQVAPKRELAVARCLVEPSRDRASWIGEWPQLVAEWHPTLNGEATPGDFSSGSGRKVWWKCAKGPDHEWAASPNSRTRGLTGCPYCARRRVSVTNSLARARPDLALQWHPERNGTLTPDQVAVGSSRRVWWRCPVDVDHEWR